MCVFRVHGSTVIENLQKEVDRSTQEVLNLDRVMQEHDSESDTDTAGHDHAGHEVSDNVKTAADGDGDGDGDGVMVEGERDGRRSEEAENQSGTPEGTTGVPEHEHKEQKEKEDGRGHADDADDDAMASTSVEVAGDDGGDDGGDGDDYTVYTLAVEPGERMSQENDDNEDATMSTFNTKSANPHNEDDGNTVNHEGVGSKDNSAGEERSIDDAVVVVKTDSDEGDLAGVVSAADATVEFDGGSTTGSDEHEATMATATASNVESEGETELLLESKDMNSGSHQDSSLLNDENIIDSSDFNDSELSNIDTETAVPCSDGDVEACSAAADMISEERGQVEERGVQLEAARSDDIDIDQDTARVVETSHSSVESSDPSLVGPTTQQTELLDDATYDNEMKKDGDNIIVTANDDPHSNDRSDVSISNDLNSSIAETGETQQAGEEREEEDGGQSKSNHPENIDKASGSADTEDILISNDSADGLEHDTDIDASLGAVTLSDTLNLSEKNPDVVESNGESEHEHGKEAKSILQEGQQAEMSSVDANITESRTDSPLDSEISKADTLISSENSLQSMHNTQGGSADEMSKNEEKVAIQDESSVSILTEKNDGDGAADDDVSSDTIDINDDDADETHGDLVADGGVNTHSSKSNTTAIDDSSVANEIDSADLKPLDNRADNGTGGGVASDRFEEAGAGAEAGGKSADENSRPLPGPGAGESVHNDTAGEDTDGSGGVKNNDISFKSANDLHADVVIEDSSSSEEGEKHKGRDVDIDRKGSLLHEEIASEERVASTSADDDASLNSDGNLEKVISERVENENTGGEESGSFGSETQQQEIRSTPDNTNGLETVVVFPIQNETVTSTSGNTTTNATTSTTTADSLDKIPLNTDSVDDSVVLVPSPSPSQHIEPPPVPTSQPIFSAAKEFLKGKNNHIEAANDTNSSNTTLNTTSLVNSNASIKNVSDGNNASVNANDVISDDVLRNSTTGFADNNSDIDIDSANNTAFRAVLDENDAISSNAPTSENKWNTKASASASTLTTLVHNITNANSSATESTNTSLPLSAAIDVNNGTNGTGANMSEFPGTESGEEVKRGINTPRVSTISSPNATQPITSVLPNTTSTSTSSATVNPSQSNVSSSSSSSSSGGAGSGSGPSPTTTQDGSKEGGAGAGAGGGGAGGGLITTRLRSTAACLDALKFSDFQAKMKAKLNTTNTAANANGSTGAGGGAGVGGSSMPLGSGGMPPIGNSPDVFRSLMQKIISLEQNSRIFELYTAQVRVCASSFYCIFMKYTFVYFDLIFSHYFPIFYNIFYFCSLFCR
jgi:hypothetical protein